MPVLRVDNLSVKTKQATLLEGISCAWESGQLVTVLGPNGAGKSTLLRSVAGLITPTAGSIRFAGQPLPTTAIQKGQMIGWCPAHDEHPFDYRVIDLVLLGRFPWHQGYPQKVDEMAAEDALLRVSLSHKRAALFSSLSSGEKRRVALARSLCGDQAVLLFDEPVANLDISCTLSVLELLRDFAVNLGKLVVVALHDLVLAQRYAHSCLVLHRGKQVIAGLAGQLDPALLSQVFSIGIEQRVGLHWFFSVNN